MASHRPRRVADEVRSILAELLLRKLSDPRLEGARIAEVQLTPDLKLATCFVSLYPDDRGKREHAVAALNGARGYLRRELGARLSSRVTPDLRFLPDELPGQAAHIEDVLLTLQAEQAERGLESSAAPASQDQGQPSPPGNRSEADGSAQRPEDPPSRPER